MKITIKVISMLGLFIIVPMTLKSQDKKQLRGEWLTDNTDSLYYKSELVEFCQSTNAAACNSCTIVKWNVEKNDFKLVEIKKCKVSVGSSSIYKEGIVFYKKGNKKIIEIKRDGQIVDQFEVIEFSQQNKILKLKRLIPV